MAMDPSPATHTTVYRQEGRFAGWPANFGMWAWGDELVVVFTEGRFKNTPKGHKRDTSQPFENLQGRSLDGGETWSVEPFNGPAPKNRALTSDAHMVPELGIGNPYEGENPPRPLNEPLDFTDPETVVMVTHTTHHRAPGQVHSWFHVSRDRCRTWQGPFCFHGLDSPWQKYSPACGRQVGPKSSEATLQPIEARRLLPRAVNPALELAGRTDVVPLRRGRALFMLTAQKEDGHEGRVYCAQTRDGGRTFEVKAPLGDEPERFEIMPSSVRLDSGRILTAVRREEADRTPSIRLYESTDEGASWQSAAPPVPEMGQRGSNPPAMFKTPSGRLALVYGYRTAPCGIRATISDDQGKSWSRPIVLRRDGGDGDLGYPRVALRADGKAVTCYYYNEHTDGERFIGATIWDADAAAPAP